MELIKKNFLIGMSSLCLLSHHDRDAAQILADSQHTISEMHSGGADWARLMGIGALMIVMDTDAVMQLTSGSIKKSADAQQLNKISQGQLASAVFSDILLHLHASQKCSKIDRRCLASSEFRIAIDDAVGHWEDRVILAMMPDDQSKTKNTKTRVQPAGFGSRLSDHVTGGLRVADVDPDVNFRPPAHAASPEQVRSVVFAAAGDVEFADICAGDDRRC